MNIEYPNDAWRLLAARFSEKRRQRMVDVAACRTNQIKLVVQDIYQPHNVSACLRSAEAFGISQVDIINLHENYKVSTPAKGVVGWLKIQRFQSVEACVEKLRADGYKLAAGYPGQDSDYKLEHLPIDEKIAVIFGNEHDGVHADFSPYIDYKFTIPMCGMVESLNISVSAALTLRELTHRGQTTMAPEKYLLSESAQMDLLNEWTCRQVPTYKQQLESLRKN